jgi:transcriptional regulator GlxA family with amidase domain
MPMLIEELNRPDADSASVAALGRLMLIELVRSTSGEGRAPRLPAAGERVRRFVERLGTECDRDWSLAEMAAACQLGRSRFASVLLELTGDTPRMVLNRLRVERATSLLRSTDWPITRIAMECGFSSSQHFANVFRQYAGLAASKLRSRG